MMFFGSFSYDMGDKTKEGEDNKIDELLSLKWLMFSLLIF